MDSVPTIDPKRIGLAAHAERTPDRVAVVLGETVVTYRTLHEISNAWANGLLELGLRPGDRVSVFMRNTPELLEAWAASGKMAATFIAVNHHFKEHELAYILNDSESSALIYAAEFEDVVRAARPHVASNKLRYIRSGGEASDDAVQVESFRSAGMVSPDRVRTESPGVAASLVYTSGTTGRPKGVFRKGASRLNTFLAYARAFDSRQDDAHLVAGPLYHSAPMVWAAFTLVLGGTVVLMPRFDAGEFLRLAAEHRANTTWVVPTMVNRMVHLAPEVLDRYDISSLRAVVVGGEPFPFALKKKAIALFGEGTVFEFYGSTENGCVTYLRPEDQLRKPGSCGKPIEGTDILLLDEEHREVGPGEAGILYAKSDHMLHGYYRNPEATQANMHDGHFTVGDVARKDADGYYYIVDRAVDMIVSGGVNIYPAEIEDVLFAHPGVRDAAVIGARDPDWGEKVVAFVVPKQGAQVSEQDIILYVEKKLASYKKPREVLFVDDLPYSPSGKRLKRALASGYEQRFGQNSA